MNTLSVRLRAKATGGAAVSVVTCVAHVLQNLEPLGSEVPHDAQVSPNAPHPRQKLESGGS